MTVKELIAKLEKEDPDRLVLVQKDGEGNGYSPLYQVTTGAYRADSTWSGEYGIEKLTEELKARGFTEEDVYEGGVPALALVPTN